MTSIGPTIPFHIARAYGTQPPARAGRPEGTQQPQPQQQQARVQAESRVRTAQSATSPAGRVDPPASTARSVSTTAGVQPSPQTQPGEQTASGLSIRPVQARAADALQTRAGSKMAPKVADLVAARVPGAVDFTESGEAAPTRESGGSLSIYRHPADRNAAATGVDLGRALDLDA